jgi:hypothetical protein
MKRLTDQEEIDRLDANWNVHREANFLKEACTRQGYRYTMSLYGVLRDKTSDRAEYRRIEVFSSVGFNSTLIELCYRFLQNFPPTEHYSIYIYDNTLEGLRFVRSWK